MKTQRFALKTPKDESNLRQFASTFAKDKANRRPVEQTVATGEADLSPPGSHSTAATGSNLIAPPERGAIKILPVVVV